MDLPVAIFRALADPTRLRIFALLRCIELSVGELAQILVQSQPRISRHIKILADALLIARRKEGAWVFLGLGDERLVRPLLAALDEWEALEDAEAWMKADKARLSAVLADRARAAEAYFNANAGMWDELRTLYVADADIEAAVIELLSGEALGRVVDLGTGTGRMLEVLGAQAESVVGIDRSPEMLRFARAKLASSRVKLYQGDICALDMPDASAETALLHQVLHYLPQPETALREAARLLVDGGRLLVVDFAPHEHEELRTRHAHARLGFSDEQMRGWLMAAGLKMETARTLAGCELTVKLWLGRKPRAA